MCILPASCFLLSLHCLFISLEHITLQDVAKISFISICTTTKQHTKLQHIVHRHRLTQNTACDCIILMQIYSEQLTNIETASESEF